MRCSRRISRHTNGQTRVNDEPPVCINVCVHILCSVSFLLFFSSFSPPLPPNSLFTFCSTFSFCLSACLSSCLSDYRTKTDIAPKFETLDVCFIFRDSQKEEKSVQSINTSRAKIGNSYGQQQRKKNNDNVWRTRQNWKIKFARNWIFSCNLRVSMWLIISHADLSCLLLLFFAPYIYSRVIVKIWFDWNDKRKGIGAPIAEEKKTLAIHSCWWTKRKSRSIANILSTINFSPSE